MMLHSTLGQTDIWPVATTRVSFHNWIWSITHFGLGQEKDFVDFNPGKTEPIILERSNNSSIIDLKIDGLVLEDNIF